MIEQRHYCQMVGIEGTEDRLPELVDAMLQLIDRKNPAFGIDFVLEDEVTTVFEAHARHLSLLFLAAQTTDVFQIEMGQATSTSECVDGTLPHPDSAQAVSPDGTKLIIRLHTTDEDAEVHTALSGPAMRHANEAGDAELFVFGRGFGLNHDPKPSVYDRGYDGQKFLDESYMLGKEPDMSTADPLAIAPDIHVYKQGVFSSIAFVTAADIGSVTVHGFEPVVEGIARNIVVSDVNVLPFYTFELET